MPTDSVRISAEEKRRLRKYGRPPETMRKAVKLHSKEKEFERVLARLKKLQRENPITTTPSEIVRMLRKDRGR